MTKATTGKTAARKTTKKADTPADAAAPAKKAKPRKAAAPKAPADTRVVTMHGETRLTHHGDGAEVLAALLPTIDAVTGGGKVAITSVAHSAVGTYVHAVPAGHPQPYETNPGVVLTVGANGLMAFDHVAVGLATPAAIEETVLSVMDAVRPEAGSEATPSGRRPDWYDQAVLAAETMTERLAA